jgi:hypothetical protein
MDLCISGWPFMLSLVIVIMLQMALPDLALWLSKLMQGCRSVRRTRHSSRPLAGGLSCNAAFALTHQRTPA